MKKLIFATNNPHKLREIREILKNNFEVDSLQDIGFQEEIAETSHTLEGNAILKARLIYQRYRRDCFADDTGLEIHALGGKPGVHSARYAGEDCIAENNIRKVLTELEGITDRKARFRTIIALILKGNEFLFEGIVNGTIIENKQGIDGFGYDPVFVPDGKDVTFAQMSARDKNKISHRGRALSKLTEFLAKI